MENDEQVFSQIQAPEEDMTLAEKFVKLNRSWVFWENYETKNGAKVEWEQSIKKIFDFDDIISFWQFWHKYPGSNLSNIFFDGVSLK